VNCTKESVEFVLWQTPVKSVSTKLKFYLVRRSSDKLSGLIFVIRVKLHSSIFSRTK